MTIFDPGAVVLVRFPFTDLTSMKKRPAVILSPTQYGERYGDVVIVPLTSVDQQDNALRLARWEQAGLIRPSWVKPLLATVTNSLIERKMGSLHEEDVECMRAALHLMLADFVWNI